MNDIPPPPPENQVFGQSSAPPPPPPEEQVFGHQKGAGVSASVPPPPPEDQVFGKPNFFQKLGNDLSAGAEGASLNGFGGLVARKFYEYTGYGIDQLHTAFPGQSDDWYKTKQKSLINQTITKMRTDAGAKQQANAFNIPGTQIDPVAFAGGMVGGADPSYFVNPGAGVANAMGLRGVSRVASRVLANTASHAALGSADDAAYQGADMIDGLQKDFDVKRNLTAAAMMGGFGAAHAGIGEAVSHPPQFVADLFKQRGVDTTPGDAPQGITKPLTGQPLSPDELQQYHQVLQTGDEHAIRGFFDGRNVNPPSFEDAHDWVKRRDANDPQSGLSGDDITQKVLGTPDNREAVQEHIDQETTGWKNKPDFEIVNHTDDIQDPEVRQAAVNSGADKDALGFVGPDGKVRIFASRIQDPATLNSVLYHESLGHYGLQQAFGDRLDATINTLMKRNVGQFGRDVDKWQKENPGAYGGDRTRAGEEVLAKMSEDGTLKPSVSDAVQGHVRSFGRKMGLKLNYNDAEVRQIVRMAHNAVLSGKGRDVRGNGFKYMFTGPSAAHFDPEHPSAFTPSDGVTRNEIGDKSAALKDMPEETQGKLGDVLDHPMLYHEYPHLRDLNFSHENLDHLDLDGGYDPNTKTIHLHNGLTDPAMRLKTVLHETQHAIQDHEGILDGREGNEEKSREEYDADPVEKEAVATEERSQMNRAQREAAGTPKFMRVGDLTPKDVHDEAYKRLEEGYTPKYRSWDTAKDAARNSALDPSLVRESRSVGNLDRKLFVYDQAARQANETLKGLAEKAAKDGSLSTEDHALAIETAGHFNYVLGRLENDASQIARGLNALKAVSFSRNNLTRLRDALREGDTNMDSLTDHDTLLKFLKQFGVLANGNNPAGAAVMIRAVSKPYWWQYLLTFRQNMMLSAMSTHLKSTMDMATTIGRELQETALAMPGSVARNSLTAMGVKGVEPGVHPTELAAKVYGLMKAAVDAQTYHDTATAFKKGSLTPRYANIADPHIPGVSKVSDLISAQDTFFRSFLMNQNLYALGVRDAYKTLKGKSNSGHVAWDDVMTQGMANARLPTHEMVQLAKDMSENTMLLNRSEMNAAIDKSRSIRPNMKFGEQLGSFMANLLTPFIRVGSNAVMNQVIRRSPLAFLDHVTRDDFKAGGARADIAMARIAMGTALVGYYWAASDPKKDKIEGAGPDNLAKFKELQAGGFAPNSIHENGRYNQTNNTHFSLNPLDTHNAMATLVAGMRESYEKGAKAHDVGLGLKLAMNSVLHDLSSETYFKDLEPLVSALTAKGETMSTKLGQLAGDEVKSFLPAATNQAAKIIDPIKHDVKSDTILGTIGNQIKASVPGMTGQLPIQYNVYGQPMKTGQTPLSIHTWVDHGNGQEETTDPTERELNRLAKLSPAAVVTPIQRSVNIGKDADDQPVHLKLDPDQAEEYQKYAGQTTVQAVRNEMSSGNWASMSDKDKIKYIREIQKQAKTEVREALLQKEGWIKPEQISKLKVQLNGQ